MTLELERHVEMLEAACHRLPLRPDDPLARRDTQRAIAAARLAARRPDRPTCRN